MANENFQEQINKVQELNKLTQDRINKEKNFNDSTLNDRVKILDKIAATQDDATELLKVEEDLTKKINHLHTIGHTELAKKYKVEQKLIEAKKKEIASSNISKALTEGADGILGGMVTKVTMLAALAKQPGGKMAIGIGAAFAVLLLVAKVFS